MLKGLFLQNIRLVWWRWAWYVFSYFWLKLDDTSQNKVYTFMPLAFVCNLCNSVSKCIGIHWDSSRLGGVEVRVWVYEWSHVQLSSPLTFHLPLKCTDRRWQDQSEKSCPDFTSFYVFNEFSASSETVKANDLHRGTGGDVTPYSQDG